MNNATLSFHPVPFHRLVTCVSWMNKCWTTKDCKKNKTSNCRQLKPSSLSFLCTCFGTTAEKHVFNCFNAHKNNTVCQMKEYGKLDIPCKKCLYGKQIMRIQNNYRNLLKLPDKLLLNHHLSGFTKTHSEIIKMNNMNRSMYTISPFMSRNFIQTRRKKQPIFNNWPPGLISPYYTFVPKNIQLKANKIG